jgi:hypothetical protein
MAPYWLFSLEMKDCLAHARDVTVILTALTAMIVQLYTAFHPIHPPKPPACLTMPACPSIPACPTVECPTFQCPTIPNCPAFPAWPAQLFTKHTSSEPDPDPDPDLWSELEFLKDEEQKLFKNGSIPLPLFIQLFHNLTVRFSIYKLIITSVLTRIFRIRGTDEILLPPQNNHFERSSPSTVKMTTSKDLPPSTPNPHCSYPPSSVHEIATQEDLPPPTPQQP